MKVMGFAGSPRSEGNTAWAVDRILEGADGQGAETRAWRFGDLDIGPCRGCLACHRGDRGCVQDDDMRLLYGALDRADALVLGSPVYMGQMSGQAKIFTDRLFAQISPRFSPHFREREVRKRLILVFTQGNPDEGMFRAYFDYTKHVFQLLEFDVRDAVVVAGLRTGPACERDGLADAMREIGASLVAG